MFVRTPRADQPTAVSCVRVCLACVVHRILNNTQAFGVLLRDVETDLRDFEADLIDFKSGDSWVTYETQRGLALCRASACLPPVWKDFLTYKLFPASGL